MLALLLRQHFTIFMVQNLFQVDFFLVSNLGYLTKDFISLDPCPHWQNIKTLGKGIWAISSHANALLLRVNVKKTFL